MYILIYFFTWAAGLSLSTTTGTAEFSSKVTCEKAGVSLSSVYTMDASPTINGWNFAGKDFKEDKGRNESMLLKWQCFAK